MALNGWKRLWVVWGVLSAVPGVVWITHIWPPTEDVYVREFASGKCAEVFAHVVPKIDPNAVPVPASLPTEELPDVPTLPKGIKEETLTDGSMLVYVPNLGAGDSAFIHFAAGTTPAARQAVEVAQVRAAHLWLVPPGCMDLAISHEFDQLRDVVDGRQIQSLDQYIRDLRFKRAMVIGIALLVWAALMMIVYMIGWTVAWVRRGFAQAPR
jgi:hypothetical protein